MAALRAQNDKEQSVFDAEYREVPYFCRRLPCRGNSRFLCEMQLGRMIEEDRRAREQALRAEAEKIYEYGQNEDEKRKKARAQSGIEARRILVRLRLPVAAPQAKGHWGVTREKKEKEKEPQAPAKPAVSSDEAFARIQARFFCVARCAVAMQQCA